MKNDGDDEFDGPVVRIIVLPHSWSFFVRPLDQSWATPGHNKNSTHRFTADSSPKASTTETHSC